MLFLFIKKTVRKQTIKKKKNRNQKYAEYDAIRDPRLFGGKFDVDLDIDDFDFKTTTNFHSNIDAKLPALFPDSPQLHRQIHSGLSTLLPHLTQLHQNLNSGVSDVVEKLEAMQQTHL